MIKSKQLENTLRSESNPFDTVYSDRTVGDLNGAIRFTALNNTGSTISAYKVVYINGVSGNTPTIALADADTASMPAFGITASAVTNGNEVDVITFGNIKGVDTSLLSVGDVLYVSTVAGEYTTTAPTGASAKLQNIGMVVKSDNNGIIKVGGAGRSAATPNLDEGKVFIGNASNQSSQSSYQLPTSLTNKGVLVANSDGSAVTSTDVLSVDTANNTVDVDDNVKIRLGTGNDFEIFHDGTNSILKDNAASGGSTMKYLAGTQTFQNKDANKTMAVFNASGSIDLHYNGVKKFETTSSGVQTTGTLNLNGAYALPTSDGSANQVLATDGSGQLSFVDQAGGGGGSAADDITIGDAAVTIATTAGDITIDAQGNDTDIIFKGTDNNTDIEMLRLDASNSGDASFNNDIKLVSDSSAIYFGADQETVLSHFHNTGLRIWVNPSVAGDNDPTLWLHKTSSTSNIGPRLWLYHDKTSASNGDVLGTIDFTGDDSVDGGNIYNYCSIQGVAKNVAADAWEGEIQLKVRKGSAASTSLSSALTVQANSSDGSTVDIIDHDGATEGLKLAGTLVTSTAAELNFLDTSVKSPSNGDVLSYNGTSLAWSAPSGGGTSYTYSAISTTTTAQAWYHYSVDTSGGAVTLNLPALNSPTTDGTEIRVKLRVAGNDLTIDANSNETIDGSQTHTLSVATSAITLVAGSTEWEIV